MKTCTPAARALRILTAAAMCATLVVVPAAPVARGGAAADAAETDADSTCDYTIVASSTGADGEMTLAELAESVNAGTSYAGSTFTLASNANYSGDPIGCDFEHAFEGTFDGDGHTVKVTLDSATVGRTEEIGLFGCIGVGGSVTDLSVSGTVTVTAESTIVRNVGSLAGYVYGSIGADSPALEGCSSTAEVTVSSTFDADGADVELETAPDTTIEEGTTDEYRTIERVGGLVGYCAGSIVDCEYYGELSVTTHAAPDEDSPTIANNIGGIAGQAGGHVITRIAESDSLSCYEPFYPTSDGADVTDATDDDVQAVTGCTNGGTVTTTVDGEAGLDRFGESTTAKLTGVGGIVGYAMANVTGCVNEEDGDVDSESGDGTGGIVGNLRGVPFTGTSGTAVSDAGTWADHDDDDAVALEGPTITVADCENNADVIALHAGGGIVGSAGTYTLVTTSANLGGLVCGMRWNKPMCGGVAGQVFGDVTLCYNRADVQTATGGGYYIAGVVGCTTRYTTISGDDVDSPVPEVAGCYNTGDLIVTGSMRQGGIVGENSAYVHDCINTGACASGNAVADDNGTTSDTVYMYDDTDDLAERAAVAVLNASLTVSQFEEGTCFVPAVEVDGTVLNDGYPILTREKTASGFDDETDIDESKVAFTATGTASYSAVLNPVPTLTATYDGEEFVQYADFYVIPDEDALGDDGVCRDVADVDGTTFYASIVGMGMFTGATTTLTAAYTLAETSFDTCSVYIASQTYNGLNLYPDEPTDDSDSDVIIMDAGGNAVPVSNYTMADQGSTSRINYKSAGYSITFTANDDSNYTGSIDGTFMIDKASIIGDAVTLTGFKCQGTVFYYSQGTVVNGGYTSSYLYTTDDDGNEVEGMYATYTGESIKPTISGKLVFTKGDGTTTNLTYGTDYKLVYGDPGESSSASEIYDDTDDPNINVTTDTVGERACVTLRAIAGTCNFTNYQNFFFDILPASLEDDCEVWVDSTAELSNGTAVPEIEVTFNSTTLVEGTDYEVSVVLSDDETSGTVTITGIGNFDGEVTETFTVSSSSSGATSDGSSDADGSDGSDGSDTDSTSSATGSQTATASVKVAKVKLKGVRAGKRGSRKLTVTWAKVKGATYRIAWRVKGTGKWKTASVKTTRRVIAGLKAGRTYQVRVRACKKSGSGKVWGAWSAVRSARVR